MTPYVIISVVFSPAESSAVIHHGIVFEANMKNQAKKRPILTSFGGAPILVEMATYVIINVVIDPAESPCVIQELAKIFKTKLQPPATPYQVYTATNDGGNNLTMMGHMVYISKLEDKDKSKQNKMGQDCIKLSK